MLDANRHPPGELSMTWLIAQRAALEALRDRMTLLMSAFVAVVLPVGFLVVGVLPLIGGPDAESGGGPGLADLLPFNLLLVGLVPGMSAVGIAAGQFAGEKERGVLTPLLASPASNVAIFGGKVLGAIIPPLLYALIAVTVYVVGIAVLLGPARLALLLGWLSLATVALVPAAICFAAVVSSLISSRVRTYNSAQQLGGLLLTPVWAAVLAVAAKLQDWGPGALFAVVGGLVVLDVCLTLVAAATWRREEVLSHI
jgi:ABC-type Na+ efflux pump permease subunit